MKRIVTERIFGFTFVVRPTVFNPNDFISSKVFASYINTLDLTGKNILDMGAGSGIVSIFAASKGANCTACDINPQAVHCITENAANNNFSSRIKAYESDLFDFLNIPYSAGENEKPELLFDIIFFNPPYFKGIPANNFERAFKGGTDLGIIDKFLLEAVSHLSPNGKLCLLVSTDVDLDDFYTRLKNFGYTYTISSSYKKLFETFYIIEAGIKIAT